MKTIIFIGGGIALLLAIVKHFLSRKVAQRVRAMAGDLYFHGVPLATVWDKKLFRKIARMTGAGLCHESAALTMLAMKGEEASRLVIAEAFNHFGMGRFKHGYVEVKMFKVWWVIDHCWCMYPRIRLRAWNNFLLCVKYIRVVQHDEFWKMALANDYREAMRNKDTSSVFWYLSAFRYVHKTRDRFDFEVIGEERFKRQEAVPECMLCNYNIPIRPKAIEAFLT